MRQNLGLLLRVLRGLLGGVAGVLVLLCDDPVALCGVAALVGLLVLGGGGVGLLLGLVLLLGEPGVSLGGGAVAFGVVDAQSRGVGVGGGVVGGKRTALRKTGPCQRALGRWPAGKRCPR
jgi:hypothetical protein